MATDYISREIVIDDIIVECYHCPVEGKCCEYCANTKRMDRIKNTPAADVVEVVRCKDCIHAPLPGEGHSFDVIWPRNDWGLEYSPCPYFCDDGFYSIRPKPDWFCHIGEKKREEDNGSV